MKRSLMEQSGAYIAADARSVHVQVARHKIGVFTVDVAHVFKADSEELLYSSHEIDLPERWLRWRMAMRRWHAVEIPDEFRPTK